jgi:hypothetical protein
MLTVLGGLADDAERVIMRSVVAGVLSIRGIRTDERFMTTFEKLFGESVIAPSLDEINVPEETNGTSATDEDVPTKH